MTTEEPTKTQLKKAAKRARIQQKYKQEKLDKKAEKETPTSTSTHQVNAHGLRAPRQERNAMFRADFESNCQRGPTVIIDCEWNDKMTDRELLSLTQQIMYSYAANKRSNRPVKLCVYGASEKQLDMLRKLPGADSWYMSFSSDPIGNLGLPESAVYLTADSEDVLDINSASPSDTWIIGGIVDRNRHKKATLLKAEELGLRTAQLPIGEFMSLKTSKVLTVNHVVQILAEVLDHKDWKQALDVTIPDRKKDLLLSED